MLRACACVRPSPRILRLIREQKEDSSPSFPRSLPFSSPPFSDHRLVPLGKCWRREVAPADLTIDKGVFPDLLSPGRRKEMSFSSHDKYPNKEGRGGNKGEIVATPLDIFVPRTNSPSCVHFPPRESVHADNWRLDLESRATWPMFRNVKCATAEWGEESLSRLHTWREYE